MSSTLWTHLDERGAAEEEAEHVGHDVVTDHAGNWHDEPVQTERSLYQTVFMKQQLLFQELWKKHLQADHLNTPSADK